MQMASDIPAVLLAPCGITCAVCYVFLRKKKACLGCRGQDISKPEHCQKCKIKDCALGQGIDFCSDCQSYPCAIIRRLDRRYRQKYQVSLIENALRLKTAGPEQYLREERERWTCFNCGGVISLHDRICSECGKLEEGPERRPSDEESIWR